MPGVILNASSLHVAVNGASAPTTGGATPTAPPVINFTAAGSSFGIGGFSVGTGPGGTPVVLDMATRIIAASGNVTLGLDFNADGTPEISLSAFLSFEQSFRPNGSQVIKLALSNLSFVLGDPADPIFQLSGLSGLFLITQQGVAASITVPSSALSFSSNGFSFTGSLTLQISTMSADVSETFITGYDGSGKRHHDAAHDAEGAVPCA